MTDRLALLRELVAVDAEHAAALGSLDQLVRETRSVRERALELSQLLSTAHETGRRLEADLGEAGKELRARGAALAEAEAELAAAEAEGDSERLAAASRVRVAAADARSMAEKRVEASRRRLEEFAARVAAAEGEIPQVESRAVALAGDLQGRPRLPGHVSRPPAAGLGRVAEWADAALAALFLARGAVAAEQDAVIRQANELGSAILGEPLVAASARSIVRRVESARPG